ncbi:MAG: NADH-quinone oxidoreductase subunit L [Candidatus Dadabacteria bacterium]|nr:MAG: NADH-quinone oxidoreductase subunit L [Candidatus Dadabacteria bacterium]
MLGAEHYIAGQSWALLRWIVLLPLLGAVTNFLLGARIQQRIGRGAVSAIAIGLPAVSFVLAVAGFERLAGLAPNERLLLDQVLPWIHIGALRVDIAFQLDPLSAVMALVVTGIGTLIHVYSVGYMDEEPSLWRFFALLNLFMFAMLTLVLGDNLLLMFVGWEGVGLCSWALIGFWYQDHANTSAGNKAFIVNRIGDFGFVLGVFLLFWSLAATGHATLTFRELAESAGSLAGMTLWGMPVVTLVTLLLFVGATGKSAQIPLYVWLPDAMAGPTPVSALIHAATMVTAGVYMIGRLSFLYAMAPATGTVVACVGAATAVFAATIGLAQNDIKKVLAYSTVSQLGYMFLAMGVGAYAAGIFHLMTHAFFKACLFLGSGSVIHALHHEQDMRRMGGLRHYMPRTFWTFLIATLAIAGVPGTAGFFSKDEILWRAFLYDSRLWAAGAVGAALTAFYMFRQVFMTFFGESRVDPHVREHLHESSGWMTWPLVVLAAGSLLAGYLGLPPALGGSNRFEAWLEPVFEQAAEIRASQAAGIGEMPAATALVQRGENVASGSLDVVGAAVAAAAEPHEHASRGRNTSPAHHLADASGAMAYAGGEGHGSATAHAGTVHGESHALEMTMMLLSVALAFAGIYVAYLVYQRRSLSAEVLSRTAGGWAYWLIYNKYWVDEIYYGTALRGTLALSRASGWFDRVVIDGLVNASAALVRIGSMVNGRFDLGIIDGIVNWIADVAHRMGGLVRRVQAGTVNVYLYVIVFVVTAVLFARTW